MRMSLHTHVQARPFIPPPACKRGEVADSNQSLDAQCPGYCIVLGLVGVNLIAPAYLNHHLSFISHNIFKCLPAGY